MNHDHAQLALSAAMDGERLGVRQAEAARAHVDGCARCRTFAARAARIRTAVRIRTAEPVPDLVGPIMAAVAREASLPRRFRWIRFPAPPRRRYALAPAVAAAIAGILVGSVVVGGPWQRRATRPIAAATVVLGVRDAAPRVDAFAGTYTIREFGLSSDVPERLLRLQVAFRSPQRFRMEVRDLTASRYPSRSWTPTDLLYIENVTSAYVSGPSGCPVDLAPEVCPRTRASVSRVSGYSAAAPLPADLVLPVATFGSSRGFQVLGRDTVDGREAIRLRLSFERAAPLFPFLRVGGTWRPFFDRDRVLLWLDAESWFPLRTEVYPSRSEERREWELRFGRPVEAADAPILTMRLSSVSPAPPDASLFRIPGERPTATPLSLDDVRARAGYDPATPARAGELELVSVVVPPEASPVTPSSLLVYAEGLDYLRVAERRDWTGPGPFGPVDAGAQEVTLDGGGIGYYEPAGEGFGRRLAIHAGEADVYLETNLPRRRLLAIASSLPVVGEPLPPGWRSPSAGDRVSVADGLETAGLPSTLDALLPGGYVVTSAEVVRDGTRVDAVTLTLRQPDTDATGEPLTLHIEPSVAELPPPSSADQAAIAIGDVAGRWTPSRSELEWIDDGTYRALQGELGLPELLAVARAVVGDAV